MNLIFAILIVFAQAENRLVSAKPSRSPQSLGGSQGAKDARKNGAKFSRSPSSEIDKSHTSVPKSDDFLQKLKNESSTKKETVAPSKNLKMLEYDGADQARYEQALDEQIQGTVRIVKKFETSKNRGEMWLRLAALYVEKAGIIDAKVQAKYDQELIDYNEKRSATKPVLNTSAKETWHRKAIQLYESFVRDFPKDSKIDQALYFLGFNYFELGDVKKGSSYLQQLIIKFPKSPYVMEAQFALGEYYFDNEKWEDALKHFDVVIAGDNIRLKGFGLYKGGWCYFRKGNTLMAISYLKKIIESRAQLVDADNKKSKLRFEKEAIRDLVVFFAELGATSQAINWFRSVVPKSWRTYVEKMAYYYSDKGFRAQAIEIFRYLIREMPTHPKAFDYQYQIVMNQLNSAKDQVFRGEMFTWIVDYDASGTWGKANAGNKEALDKSYKLREAALRSYVLQQHQNAQNSKGQYSQVNAREGYELYLKKFADSPQSNEMRFYFAELLYDQKKYQEAGENYLALVNSPNKGKFYNESLLNAVLSIEKDLPSDDQLRQRIGSRTERVEFDSKSDRFVKTASIFISKMPTHEKAVDIKFRTGRLHYMHNHFDEAIVIFKDIVDKNPNTKSAEFAANLLLDIYNLRGDMAGLEKIGSELLANQNIAATGIGSDIRSVLEKANFKLAQDFEKKGEFAKSAMSFEAFALKNPTSPLYLAAIFNAAINYERGNKIKEAVAMHIKFQNIKTQEPSHRKNQIQSRRVLAKLLSDLANYEDAAAQYQAAGEEAGADPKAPDLFFNAAVLFEAMGNVESAVNCYDGYMKRSKNKEDLGKTALKIADIYYKNNKMANAIDQYQLFLNRYQGKPETVVEVHWRISDIYKRMGRKNEATTWENKTLFIQNKFSPQRKGPGASYAAKIRFQRAYANFEEMKKIVLPMEEAKVLKAFKAKEAAYKKLEKDLGEVIEYDSGEEIIAASTIYAFASQDVADTLSKASVPPELMTPDEIQQYKQALEAQAEPYKKKAFQGFKLALSRAKELEIYNQWYFAANQYMAVLDPTFVDRGEVTMPFRSIDWMGL